MILSFMRWTDRHIGRPLCFLLTLHRRLNDLFKKRKPAGAGISRVLFIKLVEQGASVLAWPAFNKASLLVGKENIFCLVFKESRPILDVLNVFPPANIIEIDPATPARFALSSLKAVSSVRRLGIDSVIDMEFFARVSAILAYLSGACKRVGLHLFKSEGPYRGDLFTHRLVYNPYMHTSCLFASLVEALGHQPPADGSPMSFDMPDGRFDIPQFVGDEKEKTALLGKLDRAKGSPVSSPIVILNPKTADLLPARKWPSEKFVALGKMIMQRYPQATIIVTGPPEEVADNAAIASGIGAGACSLAGQTSLRELLTLYCLSDVLVSSDSGPAIFSAMTPLKSVVLFGPESPELYGIPGKNTVTISSRTVCSPCVTVYNHRQSPCCSPRCMTGITADRVFEQVKGLIDGK